MAYVYMARCRNGALYTGWTNDLEKRIAAHTGGRGAAYTKAFGAEGLAYAEVQPDKSAALRREAQLKKLPKEKKEALAASFQPREFVLLRPAVPADAADVRSIAEYYIRNSTASFLTEVPSESDYRAEIRKISRRLPYLIAHNALGEPLGFVCAHPWETGRGAYSWDAETTIYLAPSARRKGVGSMLYAALLACLAWQGYWNAYAVLADPNEASEAFHKARGFVCEGRQKHTGYKNGWQGISYWGLALKQGDEAPGEKPREPQKEELAAALEAARMGKGWQEILQELENALPQTPKENSLDKLFV